MKAFLPATATRARHGFTLVELMVSVLVLSVGLLALTGATAVVARQINGGAQMSLGASMAESRMERLRAERCDALTGGEETTEGISERWTVVLVPGGAIVTDTITFFARAGRRVYGWESRIPCRPAAP